LQETVQDGVTGFLHTPGDVMALVEDVLRLEKLGHDGRKKLGSAARSWLMTEASQEKWKSGFRQILADLEISST
jgi:hypothetical protein